MNILRMRNPKPEARNLPAGRQVRNKLKTQNPKQETTQRDALVLYGSSIVPTTGVLSIRIWCFGFVSDFEIRDSYL
jgi:hypothetical protein